MYNERKIFACGATILFSIKLGGCVDSKPKSLEQFPIIENVSLCQTYEANLKEFRDTIKSARNLDFSNEARLKASATKANLSTSYIAQSELILGSPLPGSIKTSEVILTNGINILNSQKFDSVGKPITNRFIATINGDFVTNPNLTYFDSGTKKPEYGDLAKDENRKAVITLMNPADQTFEVAVCDEPDSSNK